MDAEAGEELLLLSAGVEVVAAISGLVGVTRQIMN